MFDHQRELEALTLLCRELAALGLSVGLSDARPAVSVRADRSSLRLWIAVDASGEVFECEQVTGRFPVGEPAGAAASIAEQVKAMGADAGEGS